MGLFSASIESVFLYSSPNEIYRKPNGGGTGFPVKATKKNTYLQSVFMETRKVPVFCYWNGCIKDGPDGPLYEGGSSPRVIRVERKTSLPKLLDDLHRVTGFDKGKFKIDVIGRYPSIVQQPLVKYIRLPVVDDSSLETMLEVPTYHLSINNLEFYLEVTPVVNAPSLANQVTRAKASSAR
ncbi:hypothetical protein Rs2_47121 [Raphanus sativus]|nr:hypothetical protein Rs2_47121 [Raphanus sativus]